MWNILGRVALFETWNRVRTWNTTVSRRCFQQVQSLISTPNLSAGEVFGHRVALQRVLNQRPVCSVCVSRRGFGDIVKKKKEQQKQKTRSPHRRGLGNCRLRNCESPARALRDHCETKLGTMSLGGGREAWGAQLHRCGGTSTKSSRNHY